METHLRKMTRDAFWLAASFVVILSLQYITTAAAPEKVTTTVTPPAAVATNKSSVFTAEQIKVILDGHNKARKSENAKEMPDLKWSTELADKAQNWTDGCIYARQHPRVRRWGENIAAIGNTQPIPNQVTAMIAEWVEEKKFNTNGTFEECCGFKAGDCCQYTQVIWSRTTQVGCGYTVCQNLEHISTSYTNIAFLACYYTPTGNVPLVTYDWRPYVPLNITIS